MLQTLFHIPHDLGPLPVFGLGWLLLLWAIFSVVLITRTLLQRDSWNSFGEQLIFLAIVGGVILWVLPALEQRDLNDDPIGLPIRGYGVMMLAGVVSGVWLAVYRAGKMGLEAEAIYGLAFWMFAAGIAGARLFYVIEYWDSFRRGSPSETFLEMLRFTEGGLVVYGSVIGGLGAAAWFAHKRRLPILALADLIAPSLVVGLAFGRIGCLLNGCCYGGICEDAMPRLSFPPGSPPYVDQLRRGELLGMRLLRDVGSDNIPVLVAADVDPEGLAAAQGIQSGDRFRGLIIPPLAAWIAARQDPDAKPSYVELVPLDAGPGARWPLRGLPAASRPVHPTQVYSSLNAFLLLGVLWFFSPYRPWEGSVFALLMTLYPVSRFLLEMIRTDEPGQWGTQLSISQWVSLGVLAAVALLWTWLAIRRPPPTRRFHPTAQGRRK